MQKHIERFQQELFDTCKKHFSWMLQDGMSLPDVQEVSTAAQPIAAVALQRAGIEAMAELGMMGPIVMQPSPEPQPEEHHGQGPNGHGPEDDNDQNVPQGNPFDQ